MSNHAPDSDRDAPTGLPSNRELLDEAGISFHFFVDSAEGVAIEFDEEGVLARTKAARERLLAPSEPNPSI